MVLGNISKYVEGFESFTADDEMMLANLKQALNYTKSNMAISDVNTKLSSTNGLGNLPRQPNTTRPEPIVAPIPPELRPLPTFTNQTPSNTIIRSSPPVNTTTSSSSKMNSMPTQNNTMKNTNSSSKMNSMPTQTNSMKNNTSSFKNISNPARKEQDLKNPARKEDEDNDEEQDLKNPARKEQEESDEESDEEQDLENPARKNSSKSSELSDDEDDFEGFQGSQQIEGNTLKKMLLALLITFLGYMLILSAMNNLIPIATYAPHLKQFKHFIYGGLFFLIVYLCLEVF